VMQQWCQEANPVIEDLESLAPFTFGLRRNENDSCTICDAITCLKARCQSFLECKIEHNVSEKAYAKAVVQHEQLTRRRSSKKSRALKSVNGRLSHQAQLVARKAELVLQDAKLLSSMNSCVANNTRRLLNATVHVADNHNHIQSLLEALGAVGKGTSQVTMTESQMSSSASYVEE
jgi:hypothetical protein